MAAHEPQKFSPLLRKSQLPEKGHSPPKTRVTAVSAFALRKPEPDSPGRCFLIPSRKKTTMDTFWIMQGWYRKEKYNQRGIRLTNAKWKDDPQVQVEAIKFLIERVLKKPPKEVTWNDFCSNRLSRLIRKYYNHSPYNALVDAGYAYSLEESLGHAGTGIFHTDKFYPWEMPVSPTHFHDKRENRIAQTKWLVWKLRNENEDPRTILWEDFNSNNLGGLISEHYENSPFKALLEAGIVTPNDERYMRRNGTARFLETG